MQSDTKLTEQCRRILSAIVHDFNNCFRTQDWFKCFNSWSVYTIHKHKCVGILTKRDLHERQLPVSSQSHTFAIKCDYGLRGEISNELFCIHDRPD